MIKIVFVVAALAAFPLAAFAGPKEDALAVADKFIAAFVAGDLDATTALFAPDALFWGTISSDLGTSPTCGNVLLATTQRAPGCR